MLLETLLSSSSILVKLVVTSIVLSITVVLLTPRSVRDKLRCLFDLDEEDDEKRSTAQKLYSAFLVTKLFTIPLSEEEILQKKFEALYENRLKDCSYSNLILPPDCKRVTGHAKKPVQAIKPTAEKKKTSSFEVLMTFLEVFGLRIFALIKGFFIEEDEGDDPEEAQDQFESNATLTRSPRSIDPSCSNDELNSSVNKSVTEEIVTDKKDDIIKTKRSVRRKMDRANSISARFHRAFEAYKNVQGSSMMESEVPYDENGYILGENFLSESSTPLLIFVNSRSGGQQGHLILNQLRQLVNPVQVWDLANDGKPEVILRSFKIFSKLRLLVCGGDGTVSWIISALEKMDFEKWPSIAILPLGTGNDLARIHGWGGGYQNENLVQILDLVKESFTSLLDLWTMTIRDRNDFTKIKEVKPFMNYLGVGVDAQAALQFHTLRESKPGLFINRSLNKLWYALFGAEDAFKASCAGLPDFVSLEVDGVTVPLPEDTQGLIFLNIDSYSGGVPLWSTGVSPKKSIPSSTARVVGEIISDTSASVTTTLPKTIETSCKDLSEPQRLSQVMACDKPSSCQDGMLDVVAVRGTFHLGQIRVGLGHAQLICQCREASIKLQKNVAVQIDGEPWKQQASTITVNRKKDSAMMLKNISGNEGASIVTEVSNLLDWAEQTKVIDRNVHYTLSKEFSRRIEHNHSKKK